MGVSHALLGLEVTWLQGVWPATAAAQGRRAMGERRSKGAAGRRTGPRGLHQWTVYSHRVTAVESEMPTDKGT